MQPLARLRLQLTAWYAGVFTLVLALLGAGLFLTIRHQMSRHVDRSLSAAAAALEQAARIRETERDSARGVVVDAVDELQDRKSTRLNSSHLVISYAVFCLKKKKTELSVVRLSC